MVVPFQKINAQAVVKKGGKEQVSQVAYIIFVGGVVVHGLAQALNLLLFFGFEAELAVGVSCPAIVTAAFCGEDLLVIFYIEAKGEDIAAHSIKLDAEIYRCVGVSLRAIVP